ncbi:hypothetical protein KW797_03995 [Candidatus Parcubacteria bacterium]|nr:hypothetical protein [Candidatus Parcubacteria bacterium]
MPTTPLGERKTMHLPLPTYNKLRIIKRRLRIPMTRVVERLADSVLEVMKTD